MSYKALSNTGKAARKEDIVIADFLVSVGRRVRQARAEKRISRRILSEISGVSQRYLAQLEGGEGNISIGLLLKISCVLDVRIEWLLHTDDPLSQEIAEISLLLRETTTKQRARILKILDPKHPSLNRANRYALIGLRGAGKSTLGKLVAEQFDLPFIELNQKIEQASGIPVHEVFALYGQEGYRKLERQSLECVVGTHNSIVLAVAGGIVEETESYAYLLQHCHAIWLKAKPEEHMQRVRAQGDERPMAGSPDAMKDLRKILSRREALYNKAEAQLDTSNSTQSESLAKLVEVINQKCCWPT